VESFIIITTIILIILTYAGVHYGRKQWISSNQLKPVKDKSGAEIIEQRQPKTITSPKPENNPMAIIEDVDSRPPFQQDGVEKSYSGLRVNWELEFKSILEKNNEIVRLAFVPKEHYPWVYCKVSLNDFPKFKIMNAGTRVRVKGVIEKVDGHCIDLKDIEIEY